MNNSLKEHTLVAGLEVEGGFDGSVSNQAEEMERAEAAMPEHVSMTRKMAESSFQDLEQRLKLMFARGSIGHSSGQEVLDQDSSSLEGLYQQALADYVDAEERRGAVDQLNVEWRAAHETMEKLARELADLEIDRRFDTAQPGLLNFSKRAENKRNDGVLQEKRQQLEDAKQKREWAEAEIQIASGPLKEVLQSAYRNSLISKCADKIVEEVYAAYLPIKQNITNEGAKSTFNEGLIQKLVDPELTRQIDKGNLTEPEADEYRALLRKKLGSKGVEKYKLPPDELEELDRQEQRLERLHELSHHELTQVYYLIDAEPHKSGSAADDAYEKMADVLIDQIGLEKADFFEKTFVDDAEKTSEGASGFVSEIMKSTATRLRQADGLDSRMMRKLDGLARWQVLRDDPTVQGDFGNEVISRTEAMLVDNNMSLLPRDQDEGAEAFRALEKLGSPQSVSPIFEYLKHARSGHVSSSGVQYFKKIASAIPLKSLEEVLAGMSQEDQDIARVVLDENSYLNRFPYNGNFGRLSLIQEGGATLGRERLSAIMESYHIPKEQIHQFYNNTLDDTAGTELFHGLVSSIMDDSERQGRDPKAGLAEHALSLLKFVKSSNPESLEVVDRLSFELGRPVGELLAEVMDAIAKPARNKIIKKLASLDRGDFATFPAIIAEKIGLDQSSIESLQKLCVSKELSSSMYDREMILSGILAMATSEGGAPLLATMCSRYRGTKRDASRFRKICERYITLNEFEIPVSFDNSPDAEAVANEVAGIDQSLSRDKLQPADQAMPKSERKDLEAKRETLKKNLEYLSGLGYLEDSLEASFIQIITDQLDLPPELQKKLFEQIDEMLRSGFIEVGLTLAANYNEKNDAGAKTSLITLFTHLIQKDFRDWRYANDKTEEQFSGYSAAQIEMWSHNNPAISLQNEKIIGDSEQDEMRLRTAKELIKNAEEHLVQEVESIAFTDEGIGELREAYSALSASVGSAKTYAELSAIQNKKKTASDKITLAQGMRDLLSLDADGFTVEGIAKAVSIVRSSAQRLGSELALVDLDQIAGLSSKALLQKVTASESDNPSTLLRVGEAPIATCQSWRKGLFNECLPAYVLDGNKKVVNATNESGEIIGRTIMRLSRQRPLDLQSKEQGSTQYGEDELVLLAEPPYASVATDLVYSSMASVIFEKANQLGVSVSFGMKAKGSIQDSLSQIAEKYGYASSDFNGEAWVPSSHNTAEYSDSLKGKITTFEEYKPFSGIVFRKQ